MYRKQYALLAVLTIFGGLIGGTVTGWILIGQPAFAQNTLENARVIMAEEFRLVDRNGRTRAAFTVFDNGEVYLGFDGKDSQERVSLILTDDGRPVLTLRNHDRIKVAALSVENDGGADLLIGNKDGKIIWESPKSKEKKGGKR